MVIREKLVIFISADNLSGFVVLDANSQVIHTETSGSLEDLAVFAVDREIWVIVPGEEVLLTKALLPKMSKSRLMQALPFALEEQTIDDVENLHFALLSEPTTGDVAVAMVSKEKMVTWLSLLKTAQVNPDKCLPLTLILPWQAGTWTMVLSQLAHIRTDRYAGFSCDVDSLNTLFNETTELPEALHIFNFTNTHVKSKFDLPIPITEHRLPAGTFFEYVAKAFTTAPPMHLLQGAFAPKKTKLPKTQKLWQLTAVIAACVMVVLLVYPLGSYFILKQKVIVTDEQITQIYRKQFPHSTHIVAPKLRLQEKLQKTSNGALDNRLLLLLGHVAKAFHESQNIQINRLDFQGSQLMVEMTALSSEDFSNFTTSLSQQGLAVKQQNANLSGVRVNATLIIE